MCSSQPVYNGYVLLSLYLLFNLCIAVTVHCIKFTFRILVSHLLFYSLKNDCEVYQVIDYCKRQLLTYRPIGIITRQPFPTRNRENFYMMSRWVVSRRQIPNAFALHMLENHRGRDACYLFVPNDP